MAQEKEEVSTGRMRLALGALSEVEKRSIGTKRKIGALNISDGHPRMFVVTNALLLKSDCESLEFPGYIRPGEN